MAQISLIIPDNLLATYNRFRVENGPTWADAYLTEKLKELEQRFYDADAFAELAKTRLRPTR
mgnify:CR=1 FL=1